MTLTKNKIIESVIEMLGKHPFISTFMVCLILTPFCYGSNFNISGEAIFILAIIFATVSLLFCYKKYKENYFNKLRSILLAICLLGLNISFFTIFGRSEYKGVILALMVGAGIFAVGMYTKNASGLSNSVKEKINSFYIMSFGFFMKFFYVLSTSVYSRQNDVHSFGGEDGHAAYMEYLLFNKHLPNFDVREVYQFYHPPLHHTICAAWIDFLENCCGVDHNWARESLQMLTLFYSMACLILVYKILKHFKLSGPALYVPLAIFAVHPSFLILAGSINNDILSIVFIFATILCTLKWYQNPTMKNILKIALAIGLGMMTKLSVGLIAPATAFVFLVVLIKNRKNFVKLIKQFLAFGAVCCPLGLWWGIRNFIKFKVPFNYIPKLELDSFQYIGNIPYFERLTDFSSKQFSSVFEQWIYYDTYSEYNPTIAFLKNSIFGESINETYFEKGVFIPQLFFVIATFLVIMSFVIMIVYLFKKNQGIKWEIKVFLMIVYGTFMGNYYIFCNTFPFTCTQNFRYIAPNLLIGILPIGLIIKDAMSKNNEKKKALNVASITVTGLSVAFCALTVFTYIFVFLSIYETI